MVRKIDLEPEQEQEIEFNRLKRRAINSEDKDLMSFKDNLMTKRQKWLWNEKTKFENLKLSNALKKTKEAAKWRSM